MMLPGVTSLYIPSVRFLRRTKVPAYRPGEMIQIKSTVVLTAAQKTALGVARTTLLAPGLVVVKKTADGLFYAADDAAADRSTAPSLQGAGHVDGNGVIKVVSDVGTFSVTTTTGAGTVANHVTDLNADAPFAAHFVASSIGAQLNIARRKVGSQAWLYAHSDTMAGSGLTEGEADGAAGVDADYRVLGLGGGGVEDWVDMIGRDGAVADMGATNLLAGDFVTTALLNLTPEAKAVLALRGSTFGS